MNQLSERGRFISKSEAAMLQAVAVMLMVWHHLFGFPDRIAEPHVLLLNFFIPIETFVADFGRICIVVFAFVSGYGLRKKISNSGKHAGILKSYQLVGAQLLKFFSRYWAVFFVFVPLGFLLKVYPVDVNRFLKGVLGIGSGYNGEWWYVNSYVRFLLLFPIMTFLTDIILKRVPVLMHILMAVAVISLLIAPKTLPYYDFFTVLICFAEGMYFIESNIFETTYRPFQKKPWLRLIVWGGVCAEVQRCEGLPAGCNFRFFGHADLQDGIPYAMVASSFVVRGSILYLRLVDAYLLCLLLFSETDLCTSIFLVDFLVVYGAFDCFGHGSGRVTGVDYQNGKKHAYPEMLIIQIRKGMSL